jgi:hypothetical protein
MMLLITTRSDQKPIKNMQLDINYPTENLTLLSGKPLNVLHNQAELGVNEANLIGFKLDFAPPFQTNGAQQELVAITFKAKKSGRINITFAESTKLTDITDNPIDIWKNNYTVLITD